jgi:UDP-glucose:(heptosyl)LPS alpha-1,3-glucosyltransferase
MITFNGTTTEIAPFFAAADCYVLPTRYDTFSMATLEAMASHLPVIVSRLAGVAELLSHNHDSLILDDPDDVDSLVEYLIRLQRDGALGERLGAEARRTAERHSWDQVARQTLSVYQEALGART